MSEVVPMKLHLVNGLQVPDFVLQVNVDKLKDLELYPDDVWVVTYPKSGTKWASQIVRLIKSGGVQDDQILDYHVPWAEAIKMYMYNTQLKSKISHVLEPFSATFPTPFSPVGHLTPHHASTSMLHETQKMWPFLISRS